MKIDGKHYRTIWLGDDGWSVEIIDQTKLPHRFETIRLATVEEAGRAIKTMQVRGAPLIGATAAYGVALAMRADSGDQALEDAITFLAAQRPTAVNLRWALDEMRRVLAPLAPSERVAAAYTRAAENCDEDVETCRLIGEHGLALAGRRQHGVEDDPRATLFGKAIDAGRDARQRDGAHVVIGRQGERAADGRGEQPVGLFRRVAAPDGSDGVDHIVAP